MKAYRLRFLLTEPRQGLKRQPHTPASLVSGKQLLVPIEKEAARTLDPIRKCLK